MYTPTSIAGLVDDAVPESQSLEFKQDHELRTRDQRAELLKDLAGMGNGGGGTLLYGIVEDSDGHNSAAGLSPITDQALPGRIEDVVRAGVSPPLLYQLNRIDIAGGYVLEVVVDPSPLGPYMAMNYADARHRYFKRHGTRVDSMSEQEVRDAYALAMRAAEHRPTVWADHKLPLVFDDGKPRLSVCRSSRCRSCSTCGLSARATCARRPT
jgi:hypothetical protein